MDEAATSLVDSGRAALDAHDWQTAYRLLSDADAQSALDGGGLEALAEAARWTGRMDAGVDALERAYQAHLGSGERCRAANTALLLARELAPMNRPAAAGGWHRRAESLLESEPECAVHGKLLIRKAGVARGAGDLEGAFAMLREAREICGRHHDRDGEMAALHGQGALLVAMGRVADGMELVDDAVAAAVAGELTPDMTGRLYCRTIALCRDTADYARASEWTESVMRWCERQSISGFPGVCRLHRAELMRLRGGFENAVADALLARDELIGRNLGMAGDALGEVGLIRLRLGDLDGAEEALRQAHELGGECEPAQSLLFLARGDASGAAASISRALEGAGVEPLQRGRYLPALITIALLVDDVQRAESAADELERLARSYGTAAFNAEAAVARGALQLHHGMTRDAAASLRHAIEQWLEVDAPYEAAEARALLAAAVEREGDFATARLELKAACSTFERLGAIPDAQRQRAHLEQLSEIPGAATDAGVAFMFTDIVGSTALAEAIGDEAWTQLSGWHDRALRELFGAHDGKEVDHAGDGFLVAFPNVDAALSCAVAIQRLMSEHRRKAGFAPKLRVGLHAGPARRVGADYRGREVHVAARIAALAGAEEVMASASCLAHSRSRSLASEPRAVRLKGISAPVSVVTVDWRAPQPKA
jgi:class 3 adenylate cyclase